MDEIHLKCDVIDGSVVNGLRHPIPFTFNLDKVFCQPETIHYKRINRYVLNTITFNFEDDKAKNLILTEKR